MVLSEEGWRPALGVGLLEIAGNGYISPENFPPVTRTPEYLDKKDSWSMYCVLGKKTGSLGRFYLGGGSGRFVGWGPTNRHAHGLFGGYELGLRRKTSLIGEFDGRNLNLGGRFSFPATKLNGFAVNFNGLLAIKYLQNLRGDSWDMGLRPAISANIGFELVQSATGRK